MYNTYVVTSNRLMFDATSSSLLREKEVYGET